MRMRKEDVSLFHRHGRLLVGALESVPKASPSTHL
jgi:hypothetical protein